MLQLICCIWTCMDGHHRQKYNEYKQSYSRRLFPPNIQTMWQGLVNNQFIKDNREFMSRAYELIVALTVRNYFLNNQRSVLWNI